jgi:hypothetical protein
VSGRRPHVSNAFSVDSKPSDSFICNYSLQAANRTGMSVRQNTSSRDGHQNGNVYKDRTEAHQTRQNGDVETGRKQVQQTNGKKEDNEKHIIS